MIIMYSIGAIAQKFRISRTTLLYYEEKQLLVPARRYPSNYRTYNAADCEKLALIKTYRSAGLSIDEIKAILQPVNTTKRTKILEAQQEALSQQISQLHKQKSMISDLLGKNELVQTLSKENWVDLLSSIGLGPEERLKWHQMFEQKMPQAHQKFLESLKIDTLEIEKIRHQSRIET